MILREYVMKKEKMMMILMLSLQLMNYKIALTLVTGMKLKNGATCREMHRVVAEARTFCNAVIQPVNGTYFPH